MFTSHPALVTQTWPIGFGRYDLIGLIGIGGMAEIYHGRLRGPMGFAKEVAIKVLSTGSSVDDRFSRSLINEAHVGGQLHRTNIVEIFEFDQDEDGRYYLVMEFVDGWTLDKVIQTCIDAKILIPSSVVIEVITKVCSGLEYAHNYRNKLGTAIELVHRDIKPSNILLSRTGEVKIADFRLAKTKTNPFQTEHRVVKGTPAYMSPEQVRGDSLRCFSDIFFGQCFVRNGRRPFSDPWQ